MAARATRMRIGDWQALGGGSEECAMLLKWLRNREEGLRKMHGGNYGASKTLGDEGCPV